MKQTNNKQKIKSPIAAYMGYLFQTFLKRPFGYIIGVLYVVYLSIILLIVPASLHFEPLFIWNVGGFNMPIFNLFFIGASAASIAVAVFRTGRDDGSDLNLSAKPITKGATVAIKTAVYLIIMLAICLIIAAIVSIILPVFGVYNEVSNATGITMEKYRGLLLSILVGNIVNMLFFGGVAVFISMIGGQVITIIGTIAIVFVMCLMNFLYPQVLKSATDVLSDKYDTEALSYSCNTLHQYKNKKEDAKPFTFAAIQCIADNQGTEEYHYDTKKFWDIATKESGRQTVNYIDLGKQLSMLYSAFGLDDSKLKEASKLMIGGNATYTYTINADTHVALKKNVDAENYPISYYNMTSSQGKFYPYEIMIGANMTLDTSNWYLLSTLWQVNFDSVNYASTSASDMVLTSQLRSTYAKPWNRMSELRLGTEEEQAKAKYLYQQAKQYYHDNPSSSFSEAAFYTISHLALPGGIDEYSALSHDNKFTLVSKYHLAWAVEAQADQMVSIESQNSDVTFPYTSADVSTWYVDKVSGEEATYKEDQDFNLQIFTSGIDIEGDGSAYSRLVTSKMSYAETYANLYRYTVKNFYNITNIIAIWTVISGLLFTGSIIVYKKTDFK